MHPDCCSAYQRFCVSFPHTFRILLLRIYKIAYLGHRRDPNLQDSLYGGLNLQDSFSGRPGQSGLLPWGLQIIRIASLMVPNQLECFLGGSESLAGGSIRTNTTKKLKVRCVCQAAGVGLLSFSHTVRIVSAYVSHTQTPFCAHLAILCSPTELYRSRTFILHVIRSREANDACAGATIRL